MLAGRPISLTPRSAISNRLRRQQGAEARSVLPPYCRNSTSILPPENERLFRRGTIYRAPICAVPHRAADEIRSIVITAQAGIYLLRHSSCLAERKGEQTTCACAISFTYISHSIEEQGSSETISNACDSSLPHGMTGTQKECCCGRFPTWSVTAWCWRRAHQPAAGRAAADGLQRRRGAGGGCGPV